MKEIYDCDDELRIQSGGDNYFISCTNDTEIRTFRTKKEAVAFARGVTE